MINRINSQNVHVSRIGIEQQLGALAQDQVEIVVVVASSRCVANGRASAMRTVIVQVLMRERECLTAGVTLAAKMYI